MQISSLRHKSWVRWGLVVLAGWMVLWLLGWLVLPSVLRSLGEKMGTERLGRTVQIGQIDFRPWSLELTVRDIQIAGTASDRPLLQVQRFYLDAQWQSLWYLAPVLDALEVDAPVLHLTQQAPGRYDIDDIMARLEAARQQEPDHSEPMVFALYNIVLRGGEVHFQDQTVGSTHALRHLQLQLPLLSNLPTEREIKVQPHLAFELNGSPFSSSAEATPFAQQRQADIRLHWSGLDLKPYLGYLPASLPVRLQSALLDADLRVHFAQAQTPVLRLSGRVGARELQLTDVAASELLSVAALTLELEDVRPLERRVQLQSVQIDAPHVHVRRHRQGHLNWAGGGAPSPTTTTVTPTSPDDQAPTGSDWRLDVNQITVQHAQLDWQDETLPTPARLRLQELGLQASNLRWPLEHPVQFAGQMQLVAPDDSRGPATLAFEGQATHQKAKVALSVQALPLGWGRPYLAQSLVPRLEGMLNADLGLAWDDPALVAQVAQLNIDGLELACAPNAKCVPAVASGLALRGQNTLAELKKLRIEGAQVHLAKRSVTVQSMALTQPRLLVERDSEGQWMFERWLPANEPQPATATKAGEAPLPWSLRWADLALHGGTVAFRDGFVASPVALLVSGLQVQLKDFAPLASNTPPSALSVSARVGAGRTDPGRLEYDGTVGLAPLAVQGKVRAHQLPLHAFEPYVTKDLNVDIRRADGSFQGQVAYAQLPAGPQLRVEGDAALDDVRVRTVVSRQDVGDSASPDLPMLGRAEELLNWKSLAVRGISMAMVPGQALQLDVRETALMDFFARVVVQEDGRLNLQDWRKAAPIPVAAPTGEATTPASMAAGQAAPAPIVRIGPITLTGGRVDFSDHFIKPNYSADLSGLAGRLSAFSSVPAVPGMPPLMADLELRGRAQGTASLDITGQLNPLAQPLALDIRGQMRDLELPPLSPYTIKYAGHGIERGKLSMDVSYQVQPNGQLTAGNKLVLHQLKFGDPIEGAPASLPVRLAVALLADRNGVIDVDLPISGSLNDPEFRLGSVILKVVGNLIVKAVTAPFSLLAGILGGGAEQGVVAFTPGTAQLDAVARQSLDKLAQAMKDRPSLNMTVVGQASAPAERQAWQRDKLQQLVLAHKRRVAVRAGQDVDTVEAVSAEEYPVLLKEVYRRADLKKERNLIGMTKDVPLAQMEAVLLDSIPVPDDAMRELALARAVMVRDYLASRDLPLSRLFLGAPETIGADADWKPQAKLGLAVH
ncbi:MULTISPECIES: DUF748 domain-containing protein [Giesbergeria]|uniref:DUF748 domain-containing protein n=1 Tax=Giesbergeria sinuosa TaxID=80883 RepID=A0ABV9QDH8_9BURK